MAAEVDTVSTPSEAGVVVTEMTWLPALLRTVYSHVKPVMGKSAPVEG